MKENLKYTVKEPKEDMAEAVIFKEGMTAEFTLNDIARDLQLLNKQYTELESKMKIEAAKMNNIAGDMPEIAKIPHRRLAIYYLYYKSAGFIQEGLKQLEALTDMQNSYKAELAEISKQTGIKTLVLPVGAKVERKPNA